MRKECNLPLFDKNKVSKTRAKAPLRRRRPQLLLLKQFPPGRCKYYVWNV
jgi:hypothetical protein